MYRLEAAASSLRRFGVLMAAIAVAFIALGLGLGLGLSASGVLATHDDPNTIHACVNPLSKVARIVDDPAKCARYEELVEWQSVAGAVDVETRLSALESWQAGLACIQTSAGFNPEIDDIVFTACNVHVRDGSGNTAGATNGLGNLIVGYNENFGDERTGSHNLVVGRNHSYTSYGGLVAGENNTISGAFASVSGGVSNTASGLTSSVSGGGANTASGENASISGGGANTASGENASISGGDMNTAGGRYSSVSGGEFNRATGNNSSISGGASNTASGIYTSIAGGGQGTVSDLLDSLIGNASFGDAFVFP